MRQTAVNADVVTPCHRDHFKREEQWRCCAGTHQLPERETEETVAAADSQLDSMQQISEQIKTKPTLKMINKPRKYRRRQKNISEAAARAALAQYWQIRNAWR
jgi:hypothetical protein